jgi:ferredoxin-like protein FixX
MIKEITVNIDEKLALNKFDVDEGCAHIVLKDDAVDSEFDKLVLACPAALYKRDKEGRKTFDYAGCLECGTCRILCGQTILEKWVLPGPTKGIEYRWG